MDHRARQAHPEGAYQGIRSSKTIQLPAGRWTRNRLERSRKCTTQLRIRWLGYGRSSVRWPERAGGRGPSHEAVVRPSVVPENSSRRMVDFFAFNLAGFGHTQRDEAISELEDGYGDARAVERRHPAATF